MISRLAPWVWIGAWILAFIAGMVNAVGLLGFEHQAVTHLTGTATMLGAALEKSEFRMALHLAGLIAAFVIGCMLSGVIIKDSTLKLGRHYGIALLFESFLLCAAVPLLQQKNMFGVYLTSCACGLQNAMVSTYSGALVRTTHLTGMFTDLGIFLGHTLRGLPVDKPRLRLCFVIISGFIVGGIAGSVTFRFLEYSTLFVPGALTGFTAVAYGIYRIRKSQQVTQDR